MKKICVVTATRAEYGFLKPLIFEFKKNTNLELQIIATGAHLDKRYGHTIDEILDDGIKPTACIEIIEDDTKLGILSTMANAIKKVGEELQKLQPDMVVLLGDRYETFAIGSACVILNIPIAHISGGDVTYGAYDDVFRHSLTKMSNLHFTSCEEYRKRVIQLGENPNTVFSVGSLSIENIKNLELYTKEKLNNELKIDIEKTLLATFHPVTMESSTQKEQFLELLNALVEQEKYNVLFTRANADTNSGELNELLDTFTQNYPQKFKVVESLGILRYLSAMKYCAGVIGNSSSGILEAPSFKVPTINIGNRQKGRIQASSILNCEAKKELIIKAIEEISTSDFKKVLSLSQNPYEGENTSEKIAKTIEGFVNKFNIAKEFYDIR